MLLAILAFIAVGLTVTMFATKQAMLGVPSMLFWAVLGAACYLESVTPWQDIFFFMFFACMFGMTTFCIMASFGLRERRDTLGDEAMEEEEPEEA